MFEHDEVDLKALRLPQDFSTLIGGKKILTTVPLRKPRRQEFFRTHRDWQFSVTVLKWQGDRQDDLYVVTAPLVPDLAEDVAPMLLIATITRQDTLMLWPIRMPGPDGRQDDWSRSAMEIASLAQTRWLRMVAKRDLNAYEALEPCGTFPEPTWPELSWETILKLAFRNHIIEDLGHPVLRKLRGEE